MGYLVLQRKQGETIHLQIAPGTDALELAKKLEKGGITLFFNSMDGSKVRIGIEAPNELNILRGELLKEAMEYQ